METHGHLECFSLVASESLIFVFFGPRQVSVTWISLIPPRVLSKWIGMCVTVKWESWTKLSLLWYASTEPSLHWSHMKSMCVLGDQVILRGDWELQPKNVWREERKRKRAWFATDHFPPVMNLCKRKIRGLRAVVCIVFCILECFWHLGALCKVRCLSVYSLTTVGLWTAMEGNPKLLIPTPQPPALLGNGPQVNCVHVCVCDRGLDCFFHSGGGGGSCAVAL